VDDRRLIFAPLREAGRSVLARSGKLLFGAAMAARLPHAASAARKNKDAETKDESRKEERHDARAQDESRDGQNKSAAGADETEKSSSRSKDEKQEDSDRTERRQQREDRSDERDDSDNQQSSGEERRSVSRKQEAASDDSDDDGGHRGGRRTEEFAQDRGRDDEPNVDDTPDDVPTTPAVPGNPTIPVPTTPDTTDADLFIQSNPDVVASVSTNGGFAFARSGNVIAVSGPDGAQIIQSDNPDAVVTPTPSPGVPPSDGGALVELY
jgi:hypothetical protein